MKNKIILLLILFLGFCLRTVNLNWDSGKLLHPDDRFMTMVATDISLPGSISQYLSLSSPLNPSNNNYNFYVYGDFPLLLIKTIANIFNITSMPQINLLGRFLSSIFDTFTILIIYLLSKYLFKKQNIAILSSFFYSICVFAIQQSHFFTVDSILVFFSTLAIYFIVSKKNLLAAITFGLCLSCKTSLIITMPLFIFYLILNKKLLSAFLFIILAAITFRIFQPYAFSSWLTLSPEFIRNTVTAKNMITGATDYPPIFQWFKTVPFLYPLQNIYLFGLGPGLAFLSFLFFTKKQKYNSNLVFIVLFCLSIFLYQGYMLAKFMRYFYPIYPFLCIFAASAFYYLKNTEKIFLLLLVIIWPLCFITIYLHPNPRIMATQWLSNNISRKAIVSSEYWDDSLGLDNAIETLKMSDQESESKWKKINEQLDKIDYLIISSNRLVSSIPRNQTRFPATSKFYFDLFNNKLNFIKIAQFNSFPLIPDFIAEESFTVYDHPQVYIFKKSAKILIQ